VRKLTKKQLNILVLTRDDDLTARFPNHTRAALRKMKREEKQLRATGQPHVPIAAQVEMDEKVKREKDKTKLVDSKYKYLLTENQKLKKEKRIILGIQQPVVTFTIDPYPELESESTAFMIASDWHFEEVVKPQTVSGLNEFNYDVAHYRATRFFQNGLLLLNIVNKGTNIKTLVLALLGDFISGNIHDELIENNRLPPMEAIIEVQREILSGIEYLLDNTDVNLVIPCHSGNHPRITKKVHLSNEPGNSLEYFMYCNIAEMYRDNPRVDVIPSMGYHSYMNVYGMKIRFHHGHFIRYQGGIGGITIPVNKAIAQWNKMVRADLDVFGHYHQHKDLGDFVCNGSLIGYNTFALSIKADYETPRQAFFLIDRDRGKTITAPILLNGN